MPLLTTREREILRLIAHEQTSTQIAAACNISCRTVETHRRNLMRKTGVDNVVGLLKYAIRAELLEEYRYCPMSAPRVKQ